MRLSIRRLVLAMTLVSFGVLFWTLTTQWELINNAEMEHLSEESGPKVYKDKHTILVWHWPFGNSFNVDGDFCKEQHGVPNCAMIDDQSRIYEADVVIFHNRELIQGDQKLPTYLTRPKGQRWVWLTMESPDNNGDVKQFAGLFNWTMTYHRDADIYSPYGFMEPKASETREPLEEFIPKGKSSLVCWVVSNFSPNLKRTAIYQKLKTVIPVEVYGAAVNKRLSAESLLPTISKCYFYLAFENSLYRDYISEKLWRNAYQGGAVPVVLGPSRQDYEAVAPKDSFIHVEDFSTVEELGKYLKDLAADKDRYASYFNWRHKYTVEVRGWEQLACKFCPKINDMPPWKVYKDLDTWQR